MKYLLLNHKMNLLGKDLTSYIENLPKVENLIVFPTSIYIPYFLGKGLKVGIQDISSKEMGSVTSEVSAKQAKSIGVEFSIIAHSERRENYQEENEMVPLKLKNASNLNLTSVLCIGEKDKNTKFEELSNELEMAFQEDICMVWIAYEPLAAIGSGTAISNQEIDETILWIRSWFQQRNKEVPPILYGGSVNGNNIEELVKTTADGFLVGKSSLSNSEVLKMVEVINHAGTME